MSRPDHFTPTIPMTQRCTLCNWTWGPGPPLQALQQGHQHRAQAHGLELKRKRKMLGRCSVHTCNQPAVKRVQGRGLCPDHIATVQESAARRGWTTALPRRAA